MRNGKYTQTSEIGLSTLYGTASENALRNFVRRHHIGRHLRNHEARVYLEDFFHSHSQHL